MKLAAEFRSFLFTFAVTQNNPVSLPNLKLISAGAGSGKTFRLTKEMTELLTSGRAKPSGIIATTFTKRAAAELRERVRVSLLRNGMTAEANELKNALIGTVHGLGVKLLRRFAFEAGVSPRVDIIADEDHQRLFNLSMASVIQIDTINEIERLCEMLGLSKDGELYNWRKDVLRIVEVIRGNNFGPEDIAKSKKLSWDTLKEYLPEVDESLGKDQLKAQTETALSETAEALLNNEADGTKATLTGAGTLKQMHSQLRRKGSLPWAAYATMAGFTKKVGAKSRDITEPVVKIGRRHVSAKAFQDDLKGYQDLLFDCAAAAIAEYDKYKKNRGRIDYTDMEVLVLGLLDHPGVRETLRREVDLLMVDEFQDTSPIQLAVFLKLSQLAKQSVWVGDPKQSIYGFRGAEPRLMKAVMNASGPADPNNIQTHSWRSREDVVYACNAIFKSAFPDIEEEKVVLEPARKADGSGKNSGYRESKELRERSGILHWHFELDGKGRFAKAWHQEVTAKAVAELLANPPLCRPKDEDHERPLRPGDIAILCRSNRNCVAMATALGKQGLPAAIARTGLLDTAEATLMLACLKYVLNQQDSLSIAEILLFGQRRNLPDIVEDRLDHLEYLKPLSKQEKREADRWAKDSELIQKLNELRQETYEHATSEILNLLLERLDLRRIIVAWGDGEQRLSNVDELRRLAVTYEGNCHQQHRAASLGGFLLYLDGLLRAQSDSQGASERPEAVNVLTYHRSKGLEWPAVVAMDLDQKLRADVFGMAVVSEVEEVDLDAPLSGRWLKNWVNPYGRISGGLPWLDALSESVWQDTATEDALAEEARLLYVGFTRARDYLILPTGKTGAPWLDRSFGRGGGATPVLDPHTGDAPFDWNGHEVNKYTQIWTEPRNLPSVDIDYLAVPFIAGERPGRDAFIPAVTTEDWLLTTFPGTTLGERIVYRSPAAADPATDYKLLSQATGAFLSGDHLPTEEHLRRERATTLLGNYLPGTEEPVETLEEQSSAFREWLTDQGAAAVEQRVSLRHDFNGRTYTTQISWLLTRADGSAILVMDAHANGKQLEQQLAGLAANARAAAEVLHQQRGLVMETIYLHLPAEGILLPLA